MDRNSRTHERSVVLWCEMSTGNILLPVTPIQGVVALFFTITEISHTDYWRAMVDESRKETIEMM